MFRQIMEIITAPKKLREVEKYLSECCPKGVEVINDGKACWLHYGGMTYSWAYFEIPEPENAEYMPVHLENHKFCLELAGGIYTRRSILEAWVNKYQPNAHVVGASSSDIVYADEANDRPVYKGSHTRWCVISSKKFIFQVNENTPLPWLAMDVVEKSKTYTKA